ncbi:MAG: hypothetical protein NZ898_03310 [Myxococcota bacterium]|nr:hypothetical protein [Myxococcota bacterium]MDW8361746.1 hypothetical protein [Myxococcales bacterium]
MPRPGWAPSLLVALVTASCAPTVAAPLGASVAPEGRFELAAGASGRLPGRRIREAAASDARMANGVVGGGPAPVLAIRHGLSRRVDVSLLVVGAGAGAEVRFAPVLVEGPARMRLFTGVRGLVAVDASGDSDGLRTRVVLDAPLAVGIDASSLLLVWGGLRGGTILVDGPRGPRAWRGGALLGFGTGLRDVHALAELGATFESWHGGVGAAGLVLEPAFAIRLRF